MREILVSTMDRGYRHRLPLWLAVGILVTFFIWAGLTSVNQQVRGTGRIIPSGKMRSIQHLEGGIVDEIRIKEGQTVKPGDTMFVITDKRAQADLSQTQLTLDSDLIKQSRLRAEMEGADNFSFDPGLAKRRPDIAATERRIFTANTEEFQQKIKGLQDRNQQKVLKLNELESNINNLTQESKVAQQQLSIKAQLRNSGAISESQYLEADSIVRNFTTQLSKMQSDIPITRAELSEVQNNIEEARRTRQSQVAQDLNLVNVDINKQRDLMVASTDQVNRTTVVAPVRGVVNKVYVNTAGGVVKPGEVLADIIPLGETLIVDGRISTKDRGKVWLDLPVVAKISAYNFSLYGGIRGKLSYISADSFTDNKNSEYYQVQVTLESNHIGKDKPIYPGMTVDMDILAGKISVLQAILMPLREIKENALTEMR